METLQLRRLYRIRDANMSNSITSGLGLESSGGLRGLNVNVVAPAAANDGQKKRLVVEEIE